jgi:hypothetical protein
MAQTKWKTAALLIDMLITAVRNGELDEQLVQGSKVGM